MAFRMRRSRLRGSTSERLRGGVEVGTGTVYTGSSIMGLTPSRATQPAVRIQPATAPMPVVSTGIGVTPTVRAGILKRDRVAVATGTPRVPRVAPSPTATVRPATGRAAVRPKTVAPAPQTRDDVTGATPDTGTPPTTGSPKVPDKATGTPRVPKARIVPKRK